MSKARLHTCRSHWNFLDPLPWSSKNQGIAFIEDLDGPVSVTNDAENVLEYVNQQWPGKRLVYKDSQGEWAEIVWHPLIEHTARFLPWHGEAWDRLKTINT